MFKPPATARAIEICLRGLILIILFFIAPLASVAQERRYRFDVWTTENGLPLNAINDILQTKDGFLWMTTFDGLVRFDGARFKVFNTGNTKGIKGARFLYMYEDGAKGYVLKSNALSDILNSIRTVASGEYYISPTLSRFMVTRRSSETPSAKDTPNLKDLTPTELRILKLIAQAKTNKEIAQELFISHRTVENHRANICMKLDLHGTNALTRFVLEHKGALTS